MVDRQQLGTEVIGLPFIAPAEYLHSTATPLEEGTRMTMKCV